MSVAEGLRAVRLRIARAAEAAGRDPSDVKLLAMSKGHDHDAIRAAYEEGQRAFGENYAQELTAKAEKLGDLRDLEWHFTGHLQSNKAKVVAPLVRVVHTVDSAPLARELSRRAERNGMRHISILVEVNVSGEAQKSGVSPQDLDAVLEAVETSPLLSLRGLMTMPPFGDLAVAKRVFDTLASIRNLHGGASRLPELSMGMSDDLEIAIAAGSTIVRVGTAIFGAR